MLFNAALSFLLTASAAYGIVILDDTITLPKALSDLTATLAPNDLVYIAGGCDSEKGNEFLANAGSFACFSLSNSFYVFDPKKNKVVQKRDMPRVRYRHGAAAVNNQIWLVGGRDGMDAHVNAVDVRFCFAYYYLFSCLWVAHIFIYIDISITIYGYIYIYIRISICVEFHVRSNSEVPPKLSRRLFF